ncbi:MAG: hypothetical protein PVH23_00300 [candidate division WOR-3 bacterium]|jgi:hypothetical protein
MKIAAIIKGPKDRTEPDPIIQYLIKKGIVIKNHLRMYEHTSFWSPERVPDFLTFEGNDNPYQWARKVNVTTYLRFGECSYFLDKIRYFYDSLRPKIYTPGREKDHDFSNDIMANAYLASFFRCLGSTLDALAIEIAILTGLFNIKLTDVTFPKIKDKMTKLTDDKKISSAWPLFKEFRDQLIKFLKGEKLETGWFKQFLLYRRAFTHRSNGPVLHVISVTRIEPQYPTLLTYLIKNPCDLYGDIGDTSIPEKDAQSIRDRHLQQSLVDYCVGLNSKTKYLLELVYDYLFRIYQLREEGKLRYQTEYRRIFPSDATSDFQMFML